jgi:hypothetical protein
MKLDAEPAMHVDLPPDLEMLTRQGFALISVWADDTFSGAELRKQPRRSSV